MENFVANLCQNRYILPHARSISILEDKSSINTFFELFKKISSFTYKFLFEKINQAIDYYILERRNDISIFANILFLLSELVDHNYLERSLYCNRAQDDEVVILTETIKKATFLINEYMQNRKTSSHKDGQYL